MVAKIHLYLKFKNKTSLLGYAVEWQVYVVEVHDVD